MLLRRSDPDDEIEWADVVAFMNEQTGGTYTRDFVRKSWPLLSMYIDEGWVRPPVSGGTTFDEQRLEAEKARIKLRDERNELNRVKRDLARKDAIVELWKQAIIDTVTPLDGYVCPKEFEDSGRDIIVHLTDLHGGIVINNFANRYNDQILLDRLNVYKNRIFDIANTNNVRNCYVLLGGDLISGVIHTPLRIESNLNVIEQIKFVSMAITAFIQALSPRFKEVYVYSVSGNHSRVFPNKKENGKGEHLDALIPFYVNIALSSYDNVEVIEDNVEESVVQFRVRGNLVYGVHGDKDSVENVVQRLTLFFKEKPDIVLIGHRHTNGMRTVYDTKVIESGCVSGADNYCMDQRLQNRPEQMVVVVDQSGVQCLYDVKL